MISEFWFYFWLCCVFLCIIGIMSNGIVLLFQHLKKKRESIVSAILLSISVVVLIGSTIVVFILNRPKYNNLEIIGSHIDEIEQKYGEFDYEIQFGYTGQKAYLISKEGEEKKYYYMAYDENGIVTHVYVGGEFFEEGW